MKAKTISSIARLAPAAIKAVAKDTETPKEVAKVPVKAMKAVKEQEKVAEGKKSAKAAPLPEKAAAPAAKVPKEKVKAPAATSGKSAPKAPSAMKAVKKTG